MNDSGPTPRGAPEPGAQSRPPHRAGNDAVATESDGAALPGPAIPESHPAGFVFGLFDEAFRLSVVRLALRARKRAEPPLRSRLDGRLRKVRIPGFRDASRAPPGQLADPVLDAIRYGDHRLAGAVLNLWAASEAALRDEALRVLERAGIPPGGEIADGRFHGGWPFADWLDRRAALAERLPDAGEDAAGLMLAVAANLMPAPPELPELDTPRFRHWFDELVDLDPDAPEWDEAAEFALSVLMLGDLKGEERREAALTARNAAVRRAAGEYTDELRYLGIDLDRWLGDDARDPAQTAFLAEELNAALGRYRPVRPQGETLAEEAERAPRRAELEAAVLAVPQVWESLPPDPVRDETHQAPPEDGPDRHAAARELAELQRAHRQAVAECDRLRAAAAESESERDRFDASNATLRLAREQLDAENGRLRGELDRARSTEEHWRRAYVDARRARAANDASTPEIETVTDALEIAARAFPDALAVSLNGKSDPAAPFARPGEVFDALAWLATAYRRRGAPDIAESCPGWFHKPDQSESTVGMYPDWYRTSYRGRAVPVTSHIGKGASFDPRSTIRIGFAWDEEARRVIVGYVGRHQRNRKS